jgi:uncharacterized lipoprotein YddW (UPF0748 family)
MLGRSFAIFLVFMFVFTMSPGVSLKVFSQDSSLSLPIVNCALIEIVPNPVRLLPGEEKQFSIKAYNEKGEEIAVPLEQVIWRAERDIGTISNDGVLMVPQVVEGLKYGYVEAEYNGMVAKALVIVGNKIAEVIEDFENIELNGKVILSTGTITQAGSLPATATVQLAKRPEPVLYGEHSAKFMYNMRGTTGTTATYLSLRDISTGSLDRPIPGIPKKIGVWVYGNQNNHWLRARLRNSDGKMFPVDLTTTANFNWTGWKYVTANIPSDQKGPFKFMDLYIVETKDTNKDSGFVYYDRLSVFYTDTDVFGVDIIGLTPMQVGETKQAKVAITLKNSTSPEIVNSGITYLSSNPNVASIDNEGNVIALRPGKTTIVALYGNAEPAFFELLITESEPIVDILEIYGPEKIEAGMTGNLQVFAKFNGYDNKIEVTKEVNFINQNPEIATVSKEGIIQALSEGETTIIAKYKNKEALYSLKVTKPTPVLSKIELTGLKSMTVQSELQAKVIGVYTVLGEEYERIEIKEGVTFKSSRPEVAEINQQGLVKAKLVGVTVITANYLNKTASYVLVVNKEPITPKREFRAAWIATVDNIDWPKKGVYDPEQQKQDFIEILDKLKDIGMNAIIVQIRPTADSFYPSKYFPWSHWLTGIQGKDPGYDPLAFMIEEVHKRNLEFHAWINPYRVSMGDDLNALVDNHPAKQHPEWVVSYGGKLWFNPGNPEVKEYIINSIIEVVKNYDIDAIHFDDYFYPYPVTGVDFPDEELYQKYGVGFESKEAWRRNNVDTLISELSQKIKATKPYVKFGISPFGIWRNKSTDPNGSETNGFQSYDSLYADTRKWVQNEWIDYIVPQIYWYFNYSPAAYEKLVDWWRQQTAGKNVHLYIGHAAYRVGADDVNWLDPDQLPNQVLYNRNFENVYGSVFFATNNLLKNPLGVTDHLKELFKYPALVPQMEWLTTNLPSQPIKVKINTKEAGIELKWEDVTPENTAYYVIYRVEGEEVPSINDAKNILALVRKSNGFQQTYLDLNVLPDKTYSYAITGVNRINEEGVPIYITVKEASQGKVIVVGNTTTYLLEKNKLEEEINDKHKKELKFDLTDIGTTSQKELEIPLEVLRLLEKGNKRIIIKSDEITLEFNSKTVVAPKNIFKLIEEEGSLTIAINNKGKIEVDSFNSLTNAYEVILKAGDKVVKIKEPFKISFNLPDKNDFKKVGVYFWEEKNGRWEHIGGKADRKANTITVEAKQMTIYTVFEHEKKFIP